MDQASRSTISAGTLKEGRFSRFHTIIGRAVVYVPVAMAVWWFLLKPSSLWLLRILAWLPLALLVAPAHLDPLRINPDTHEWVFNVAVNTVVTNPQTGEHRHIDSVEIAATDDNLWCFACGWFCYLALALSAAGFSKSQAKRILMGMGVQTMINILCLAAYAYINGYGSVINVPGGTHPGLWLSKYVYYVVYLVLPYIGPFAVALLVHPEWRAYCTVPEQEPLKQRAAAR